jgi:hypothetical protein
MIFFVVKFLFESEEVGVNDLSAWVVPSALLSGKIFIIFVMGRHTGLSYASLGYKLDA